MQNITNKLNWIRATMIAIALVAGFGLATDVSADTRGTGPTGSTDTPSTETTETPPNNNQSTAEEEPKVLKPADGEPDIGITTTGACGGRLLGFPTWYNKLPCDTDGTAQIKKLSDVWIVALNILEMFIIAAGYLAIGFFAWGGFTYMTASGDPGKIAAAKNTLLNAVIGLVIVLSAVAIIDFVQKGIQNGL